jgi:hypothetical protein
MKQKDDVNFRPSLARFGDDVTALEVIPETEFQFHCH